MKNIKLSTIFWILTILILLFVFIHIQGILVILGFFYCFYCLFSFFDMLIEYNIGWHYDHNKSLFKNHNNLIDASYNKFEEYMRKGLIVNPLYWLFVGIKIFNYQLNKFGDKILKR